MKLWKLALGLGTAALVGCGGDAITTPGATSGVAAPPDAPSLSAGPTARVDVYCPANLTVGQSGQCVAYGYDANNHYTGNNASWSSTSHVSITSSGYATGVSAGTATVWATIDGVTGSTTIQVSGATPTVSIWGDSPVLPDVMCGYWASTSGGTPQSYAWSVTGASGTANGSEFMVTNWGSSHTIYVTVTFVGGAQVSAQKAVTVDPNAFLCRM